MQNLVILFLFLHLYFFIIAFKLYQKSGYKAWQAIIPFYSVYIWTKIIDRPWWWTILFYIPVVGNVMAIVMALDLIRAFGYRSFKDFLFLVLSLGLFLIYVEFNKDSKYNPNYKKTRQELDSSVVGAIVFAVVAASVIRAFTFEAYTIPTSSMENSMLVGDFLFVNKMSYGTRLPITPISVPLLHDSIPVFKTKSYLDWIQLPYFRLPGYEKIDRNEIVVFNYPADSDEKPLDKKQNYVKRCVAIAGDTLELIKAELFINGKPQKWGKRDSPRKLYKVESQVPIKYDLFKLGVREWKEFYDYYPKSGEPYLIVPSLTKEDSINIVKTFGGKVKITPYLNEPLTTPVFPRGVVWDNDDYGPLYIPKKGDTIIINETSLPLYERLISVYEKSDLEKAKREGKYLVKQNYYFMMGDNRNNSLDSRYWGFVPEDHIVGKPVFIWFSLENLSDEGFFKRIRYDRIFTTVHGDGERVSYFFPIVIGSLVIYFLIKYLKKRKKKAKK